MSARRWQPPPLHPPGSQTETAAPQVRVDEHVVRQMLQVNPNLRQGRTTHQVKRALEAQTVPKNPSAEPAHPSAKSGELQSTVDFFLGSKFQALKALRSDFQQRRQQLEAEEKTAMQGLQKEVLTFLGLLDAQCLRREGPRALSKHAALLRALGLDPTCLTQR